MKPHSGDSTLILESKMTVGEKFQKAYRSAMVAVSGNETTVKGREILISKKIERLDRGSGLEDPIRTMMFLGSWSHT
ncbi:hypothetical protein LguiB_000150 [Lonicera macranthoides]